MENFEENYTQRLNQARASERLQANAELSDNLEDEEDEEDDMTLELENPPKHPSFPFIIMLCAVLKDMSDVLTAGFLGIITSAFFGLLIFFWIMLQDTGIIRKLLIKKVVLRIVLALLIGLIPIAGAIIPEATILVLLIYLNHYKIVNNFYATLEKIEIV
ncbi:MAG: hypothetical protein AAB614_00955 [Patescibacteria group bacterium]